MFYTNLSYNKGVITTEVCKNQISLSIEEFIAISDLPYIDFLYTSEAPSVVDDFDFLYS